MQSPYVSQFAWIHYSDMSLSIGDNPNGRKKQGVQHRLLYLVSRALFVKGLQ